MLRYIGEYKFRDIVNPKGIPRIVPQALFDKVQRERAKNKRATARHNLKRGKRFDYRMLRCTSESLDTLFRVLRLFFFMVSTSRLRLVMNTHFFNIK